MDAPLRVLLVEDSEADARLIVLELQQSGYDPKVERLYTPETFRAALTKKPWDIVIADYFMPRFDGLDALAMVKESGLDLPFIIVSGVIGEDVAVAAMKSGAHDYVMKDRLTRLGPAVQRALQEAEGHQARRKAEEEVARLVAVIEQAAECIVITDLGGKITYVNPFFERLTGYSVAESLGQNPRILQSGYHDQAFYQELWDTIASGNTWTGTFVNKRKDGSLYHEAATIFPIKDAAGKTINYAAVKRDITERKRMEEALRQRNRELALINRVSQELSSTLDPDQVLIVAMEEVCQILDVTATSIWLVDSETGELVCRQAIGPESSKVRGWRLSPEEGIVGWVSRHGQSLIVPDARTDARHCREVDQRTGLGLCSIVSIPLKIKRNVIGVLQVVDTEVGRFSERDLALLEPLAVSVAIAFENAQLYEQAQQEIAERERAEAALRENEERFRAVVEGSVEGILVHRDTKPLFVNPAYVRILGYESPDEILTMDSVVSLIAPYERERLLGYHATRSKGESAPTQYEYDAVCRDGSIVTLQQLVTTIPWDGEQAILATIIDITARKRAEEDLRAREHYLALLNDITRAALEMPDYQAMLQILADRLGELLNAGGCYITLWDEARQMTIPAAAYGEVREEHPSLRPTPGEVTVTESILRAEHPLIIEDVFDTPYLSRHIAELFPERSLLGLPLMAGDQKLGAVLVSFNELHHFTPDEVSRGEQAAGQVALAMAKAQLVDVLRQRTAELEARNEELDAFAHTVAHDLQNPLSLIIGYAKVLEEDHATMPEEKLQDSLQTVARAAFRVSRIVDELLLLAELRQMEVAIAPLDMASIVAEAQQRLAGMIKEHQAEVALPEVWPTALGYGPWIEAVWANYLSNAIKYGGRPPRVELGATVQSDGAVRFWVRDDGPGLTPEEQSCLFTPFTRLDQTRAKGHGLGLSIARRIMEKLGGQVGVESDVGKGSVFTFTLPGGN